jgi:outer membrane protein assembly factor BamB
MKNAAPRPGHHVAAMLRRACWFSFTKNSPQANNFRTQKPGGDVMISRLALSAAVAATVLFGAAGGAFAETYEVAQLVPGSAFHGVHGLGIDKAGRLFAGSVAGAALYEVDRGNGTAKILVEKMGGLNGFEFGPDDLLYGPLWFKGQVVKVDVDKGELTVVADGFKIPAAVNFDSKGNLSVVDTALGQLVRLDPKTGAKKTVAQLKPSLDNSRLTTRIASSSPTWPTTASRKSMPKPARQSR